MDNLINDYWFLLIWSGVIAGVIYTFLEHRYNRKPDKRKTLTRYQNTISRDYKGKK